MRFTVLLVLAILTISCQHVATRKPSSEKLSSTAKQHILIVTHATTEFDQDQTAAAGINQLVREFKAKGRPVVYLVSDQSEKGRSRWYTVDRSPDFEIFSEGGEHNLPIAANEVTIVGGFFGSTDTMNGCHALTVKDAIRMHFEISDAPLTIHIPLKATYFYPEWEAFRQAFLTSGRFDPNSIEIKKYPFASMFFLREGNDGAGDDGNEQIFARSYFGQENKTYVSGEEVSREKYQFNFFMNDLLIESVTGSGKRIVNLKLQTH